MLCLVVATTQTAPNTTMLFAIKLEVSKATSMDSECIILIINSLDSARKTVNIIT